MGVAAVVSERVIPFTAGDGMQCSLVNVRSSKEPGAGPVLLVHGAGVRGNIFRPPVRPNVVDLLIDAGYDVWIENWRASIDVTRNRWTLDEAALHDHPAAVRKVAELTGARHVKAIIHCQGSTSFAMSALAGLVPEVTTIVSNAVSLHPVVPASSRAKMDFALPLLARMTPYVDPQWGLDPPHALARLLTWFIRATHHECDNIVCRWTSFTYGVGYPTLWRHENLDDATHDWMQHEFGAVPMKFFQQIARCIREGRLVSLNGGDSLPLDFAAQPPRTTARWALFAGERNCCFLPESQVRTHRWLDAHRPGFHSLHLIPGYGHLDIFMGRNAGRDVLPKMIEELNRPNETLTRSS